MKRIAVIGATSAAMLLVLGLVFLGAESKAAFGGSEVEVYFSDSCGCCHNYIDYLNENGANLKLSKMSEDELEHMKEHMNMPHNGQSCHTLKIGDYFIEGHVPIEAIEKLLSERPDIDGISVPGMPHGTPGMGESKGEPIRVMTIKDGNVQGVFMEL